MKHGIYLVKNNPEFDKLKLLKNLNELLGDINGMVRSIKARENTFVLGL